MAGSQHQTRRHLINSAPSAAPRSNAEQHHKTITVDDTTAAVGTGNQDGVCTCAKKSCSPTTPRSSSAAKTSPPQVFSKTANCPLRWTPPSRQTLLPPWNPPSTPTSPPCHDQAHPLELPRLRVQVLSL